MDLNLQNIKALYFVGIGGIGMSALARYFKMQGKKIYGYDRTKSSVTTALLEEGMEIVFEDKINRIPGEILKKKDILIVYTPAVGAENEQLNYFITNEFTVVKRAVLLGAVTDDTVCLAVAGTHGKTTTSAILSHLMIDSGMEVTAFLGGIAENYDSNFIYKGNDFTVVEADEYDRSFLRLNPDIACVTSMDSDHLDVYGEVAEVEEAYRNFALLVNDKKKMFIKNDLPLLGMTVGVNEPADIEVTNIRVNDGGYVFDLKTPDKVYSDLMFYLPGHHNLSNAAMAFGMALAAGVPEEKLKIALQTFKGVRRRFSYKIKTDDLVLIDDYAHHPTELNALFQAVQEMFPKAKKQIVFQPHLYSRTRDFFDGFAKSLSQFDEVVLLDIYPAREKPIPGITSEKLLKEITAPIKSVVSKEALTETLENSDCQVKLLVGAGDIGEEVERITNYFKR